MGITGSYAGQLFGLLIGFGIAMIKKTIAEGDQAFNLFTEVSVNLDDIIVTFTFKLNNQKKY